MILEILDADWQELYDRDQNLGTKFWNLQLNVFYKITQTK